MPDKNIQDWNDDAAFWDEAWADMEQRLDGKKTREGALLWTRWIVLLTLLLGGIITARAVSNFNTPESSVPVRTEAMTASKAPPAEETLPPSEQTNDGSITSEGEEIADAKAADRSEAPQQSPMSRKKKGITVPTYNQTDLPQPPLVQESSPEMAEGPGPLGKTSMDAAAPEETTQELPAFEEAILITERPIVSPAVQPLPWSKITLSNELHLAESIIKTGKQPLPLIFEAGTTIAQGRQTPGYYIGLATELSRTGRISVPLSLRYRRDRMRLGESSAGGEQDNSTAGNPTAEQATNAITALEIASGNEATALTTSGIELTAGIQYKLSPKLHLGVGFGGEYLLTANGLINASRDGDLISYTFNNLESANADLLGVFTNVSASNRSFSGVSGNSGINRLRLRTEASLYFRILPRIDLSAGVTRVLSPTYSSDLLRVRPTQFKVGLYYRLR